MVVKYVEEVSKKKRAEVIFLAAYASKLPEHVSSGCPEIGAPAPIGPLGCAHLAHEAHRSHLASGVLQIGAQVSPEAVNDLCA